MATIKVFDCEGVKVLKCFDTLDNVLYEPLEDDVEDIDDTPEEKNPFE